MGWIPFAAPQFRPGGDRITDILMEQGRIAGAGSQRQGDIWGSTVAGLGQQAAGTVADIQQAQQMAKRDAALDAALSTWDGKDPRALFDSLKMLDPKSRLDVTNGMVAFNRMGQKDAAQELETFKVAVNGAASLPFPVFQKYWGTIKERLGPGVAKFVGIEELPEQADEETYSVAKQLAQQFGGKQPEGFTLSPGQQRFGPDGQPLASVPAEAPKPAQPRVVGRSLVTDDGQVIYRDPEAAKADTEPLMAVIGDDGQPVFLPRSQAIGRRPASQREQGRPVTSGDAGKIADLDTSLDDLDTLEKTLTETKGSTGTKAKAGTMLPNALTELTGWGEDAKKRQGVIDRVKQVIGKALEGGVLRKEDEYKYEKILPTIGDTQAVAESKLTGLRAALIQRRSTTLDALSDAGYDVSRFNARPPRGSQPATPKLAPEDDDLLKKYGY